MERPRFALLVTLLLLCGCEKKSSLPSPSPSPQSTAQESETGEILIGAIGSLTGAEANFGQSTQRGYELALREANAQGGVKGRKVQLRTYDDQSKPEEAGNAATRLIAQDKVKLILGEAASTNSMAIAEKAQQGQVPQISPSSTNPAVTEKGDYIFRVCFIDPFQGFVMARFAKENLGINRVAVLQDNKSAYSLGLAEVFIRKFSELGGKIVGTEAYAKGDSDFRAQLTALRGQKPEALYVPGYYSDMGPIARQARELGLTVPLLGGDGWDSPKLVELGGSAIEGSYFSNHYSVQEPSPRTRKFVADYQAAYGQAPDALGALGYDAATLAVDALRRAKEVSGPAIREALAATRDFPGVAGTISFDAHRNPIKPAVVLQVKDGSYHYVATVQP